MVSVDLKIGETTDHKASAEAADLETEVDMVTEVVEEVDMVVEEVAIEEEEVDGDFLNLLWQQELSIHLK